MVYSYGVSLAMVSHSVTCYPTQVNTPPTPATQAGTRSTYPEGMEGWVDLVDLIAPRPGVEQATFRSRVQRSTNATTKTSKVMDVTSAVCRVVVRSPVSIFRHPLKKTWYIW